MKGKLEKLIVAESMLSQIGGVGSSNAPEPIIKTGNPEEVQSKQIEPLNIINLALTRPSSASTKLLQAAAFWTQNPNTKT